MALQIEHGTYGAVSLDGLGFIILGLTPEAMGKGNWSVGLVTDARATAEQRDAMTAIASGAAGGPMAALSGLIGTLPGRRIGADHLRSPRCDMVRQGVELRRHGGRGCQGFEPPTPSCASRTPAIPRRIRSRPRTHPRVTCRHWALPGTM